MISASSAYTLNRPVLVSDIKGGGGGRVDFLAYWFYCSTKPAKTAFLAQRQGLTIVKIILQTGKTVLPTGKSTLPTGNAILQTGKTILSTDKIILRTRRAFLLFSKTILQTGKLISPMCGAILTIGKTILSTGQITLRTPKIILTTVGAREASRQSKQSHSTPINQ